MSGALVELVDVYPTIAELAGVPVPSSEGIDGVSLAPFFEDPERLTIPTTIKQGTQDKVTLAYPNSNSLDTVSSHPEYAAYHPLAWVGLSALYICAVVVTGVNTNCDRSHCVIEPRPPVNSALNLIPDRLMPTDARLQPVRA